jgi:hypothetical protein
MRIIYAAGNRIGAGSQLYRFIQNLPKEHVLKTAAYIKSSYSLPHIDWTLDSLHYNVQYKKSKEILGPKTLNVNHNILLSLISDIEQFEPDLIITDDELTVSNIANKLNIKLWYCSPVFLFSGIEWDFKIRYYSKLFYLYNYLWSFPEAEKTFIYSPFGDINFRPQIKYGYNWITPYHVIQQESNYYKNIAILNNPIRKKTLSNIINYVYDTEIVSETEYEKKLYGCNKVLTEGETSFIADAIYNEKNVCCFPSLDDVEGLLNSMLLREYSIGEDLSQVELMENYALEAIEKALSRDYNQNFLNKLGSPLLHEVICPNT